MNTDRYRSLSGPTGPHELKEKGSRFLAYADAVPDLPAAELFVGSLRKKYHDATHVCWAARFGDGVENAFRYSDDGEPSGAAGPPLYQELVRRELFAVVVAVVRYFGGVKLGTGGLVRAYGGAARLALDAAAPREVPLTVPVRVAAPFELVGLVLRLAEQLGDTTVVAREYGADGATIELTVPRSLHGRFIADIVERSSGRVRPSDHAE